MMSLPMIPSDILGKIEKSMEKFIWNGKRAKIPLTTIMLNKEAGGLGLVNLRLRHQSLLINWIKIIQGNTQVRNLAKYFLGEALEDNAIFKVNLNKKHINQLYPKHNFWTSMVQSWCEYNYHVPNSVEDILQQKIFYNSNLVNKNILLKPMEGFSLNLCIEDILKGTSFRTFDEFRRDHQAVPAGAWLQYATILTTIPTRWKETIQNRKDRSREAQEPKLDYLLKCSKPTSEIYHTMNGGSMIDKTFKYWEKTIEIDYSDFRNAFKDIYYLTNVPKLRVFQFRLLHNKIFCNNILFHWKITATQNCDFCNAKKQTSYHLICECKIARKIWEKLSEMLYEHKYYLDFDNKNIILNKVFPKNAHIINFWVLVAKYVIFRCKCNGTIPSIQLVISEIKLMYDIEHYIASKNNKLSKHNKKWNPVTYVLQKNTSDKKNM